MTREMTEEEKRKALKAYRALLGSGLSDEMYYMRKIFDNNHELQKGFSEWFGENMIYCGDTHSFTHRLFTTISQAYMRACVNMNKPNGRESAPENLDYRFAQNEAFKILDEMRLEYTRLFYKTPAAFDKAMSKAKKDYPRPKMQSRSKHLIVGKFQLR